MLCYVQPAHFPSGGASGHPVLAPEVQESEDEKGESQFGFQ